MSGTKELQNVLDGYIEKKKSTERGIELRLRYIAQERAELEVLNLLIAQIENLIDQRIKEKTDEHQPDLS